MGKDQKPVMATCCCDLDANKFEEMKQAQNAERMIHDLLRDLKCCSIKRDLQWGRRIHRQVVESWSDKNMHLVTALIKMYGKCASMVEARRVFDSVQRPSLVSWTALLLGYAGNGEGHVALDLFFKMKSVNGLQPDSIAYVAALKACTTLAVNADATGKRECLEHGREIHSEIGRHLDHYVQSALIGMYSKCSSMVEARRVFERIQKPNVVCWTALILGYAENGEPNVALDLFFRMKTGGCAPDVVTYVAALKACTCMAVNAVHSKRLEALERGKEIHSEIGSQMDRYLQNTLIDMYAKCDSMKDAYRVFESIDKPDLVSWNTLIQGYAENGEGNSALGLFSRMKAARCPDSVTYIGAIKACTSLAVIADGTGKEEILQRGREIHSEIGCHLNHFVKNTLIDMYTNCGSMEEAHEVFDNIQRPDVISWTALILGYTENGEGHEALDLFLRMKSSPSIVPGSVTYIAALKACGSIGALAFGRKLHLEISEFTANVVTCIVDFYAKCGSMEEACEVFELHSKARVVSTWNALLAGYGSFGEINSMFDIFEAMQDEGFKPNSVTFVSMLSCCSHAGLVEKARNYFEAMPVQYGVIPSVMHYTCMVDVLGRANQLKDAVSVLRKMPFHPNAVTWMTLLGACHKWKNVEIGRWAFQCLVYINKTNAAAYLLMAHIYASRGMFEEQEKVLESRIKSGVASDDDDDDVTGDSYVIYG